MPTSTASRPGDHATPLDRGLVPRDRGTSAINLAEDGAAITNYKYAWTGTSFEGHALPGQHCLQWTNATKDAHGAWGNLSSVDKGWTNYTLAECQFVARLICIEE